jgi:RNA polymerase sigma-70 factor (ECF subfamily)
VLSIESHRLAAHAVAPATHGAPPAGLRQNEPVDIAHPAAPASKVQPDIQHLADAYAQLRRSLLAFLRKHTGDPQVAEDLLHDVFVKALAASAEEDKVPHNLSGWLYAVARNAAMDHHRRSRPMDELPEDLVAPESDDNEAALVELAGCLRPLAERLPPTYRATLIAADFDGLPHAEVARRQGLSLAAVKTRVSRGRRLLLGELVTCCRVALSASGEVLDYDAGCGTGCSPEGAGGPCSRSCAA